MNDCITEMLSIFDTNDDKTMHKLFKVFLNLGKPYDGWTLKI